MIANFFKKTKLVNIFYILILLFLYYLSAIILTNDYEFSLGLLFNKLSVFLCLLLNLGFRLITVWSGMEHGDHLILSADFS